MQYLWSIYLSVCILCAEVREKLITINISNAAIKPYPKSLNEMSAVKAQLCLRGCAWLCLGLFSMAVFNGVFNAILCGWPSMAGCVQYFLYVCSIVAILV